MTRLTLFGLAFFTALQLASAAGGTWSAKQSMPTPRMAPGVGIVGDVLYAIGGNDATGYPVSPGPNEAYNPLADSWAVKSSMPTARWGLGVAVVNGIIYAMGGCGDNACGVLLNTMEAYDPVTDTWTPRASMPTPRREFLVGVIDGIIYVVGGKQGPGSSGVTVVEAYDPATDTWTTKAPMPTERGGLFGGVVGGMLYACGGTTGYGGGFHGFATVEAYDPVLDLWMPKSDMPEILGGLASVVIGDILYSFGWTGLEATTYGYDAMTDTWFEDTPMAAPRAALAAGAVNGVAYVLGGIWTPGALAVNEAFTPPMPPDTTPPVIVCPADLSVGCSPSATVPVNYTVTATDAVDPAPGVVCVPPSGSGFPIGTTVVTCTATDASGNQSTCTFRVTRAPLAFEGFLPPIGGADSAGGSALSPVRTFKMGSTIPVKFNAGCDGTEITNGVHTLRVMRAPAAPAARGLRSGVSPAKNGATYSATFVWTGSQWRLNLNTKVAAMSAGPWQLIATLSDGSEHWVWIQLK